MNSVECPRSVGRTEIGEEEVLWVADLAAMILSGKENKYDGEAVFEHARRVYKNVTIMGGTVEERQAALLHDVVEDSDFTISGLRDAGVGEGVLAIVDALTRRDDEPYIDYIRRIAPLPSSRIVKRGDLTDNTDPERRKKLPMEIQKRLNKKYAEAVGIIDAAEMESGMGRWFALK